MHHLSLRLSQLFVSDCAVGVIFMSALVCCFLKFVHIYSCAGKSLFTKNLQPSDTLHSFFFGIKSSAQRMYVESCCLQTALQTAAMLEAAAQAKKIRDREMTKSKKPSTLKKVGSRVFFLLTVSGF